jgi:hypothetical protein
MVTSGVGGFWTERAGELGTGRGRGGPVVEVGEASSSRLTPAARSPSSR